jgi:hypothetical protein
MGNIDSRPVCTEHERDPSRSLARIEIPQRTRLRRNVSRAILRSEKHGRHQQ